MLNYVVIKANVLVLCKWILVSRSWLIFRYIWYFPCFYFQNTSYLRNWNKLVVKILWLQGSGATQASLASAASRTVLRTQDAFMHPQGGKDRASQGHQNKELTTTRNPGSKLAVSCFHCSVLLNLLCLHISLFKFSCLWEKDDPSTVHENTFSIRQARLGVQLSLRPLPNSKRKHLMGSFYPKYLGYIIKHGCQNPTLGKFSDNVGHYELKDTNNLLSGQFF